MSSSSFVSSSKPETKIEALLSLWGTKVLKSAENWVEFSVSLGAKFMKELMYSGSLTIGWLLLIDPMPSFSMTTGAFLGR
jgi:hypothetical protein